MSFPYTSGQLFSAAMKAMDEDNQLAAEGIFRLMAIHYPHEAQLVLDLIESRTKA